MATEREKKDEARRILREDLVSLPLPIRRLTPIGRLYELSKLVAEGLVELDPLNLISSNPIEDMVNDPSIKITKEMMDIINDDSLIMTNGFLQRVSMPSGRDVIRSSGQFDRQNLLPRNVQPVKRTRKKTKTDKNMSKALRLANERFRTSKGKLRKGATQAQIMKFAHKLLRKM